MNAAQVRLFSQTAATSRNASFGETATFGALTLTVVCEPLENLMLEPGGFEQDGMMRALISGDTIPNIHDRLVIRGKNWVVKSKFVNVGSVETGLILEVVP